MSVPFTVILGLRAERAENKGDAECFLKAKERILELEAKLAALAGEGR